MQTRREMLGRSAAVAAMLGSLGLLPGTAQAAWATTAFEAKNLADALKALGAGAPVESKEVTLQAPDIAENGAVVPLGCSTNLPGARRLLLLVEKNPAALCAVFDVSESIDASVNTRVKMSQTSNVYAVALMADGKVLYAAKEVKVTLGGCGG
ncbi:thiosulfate oxidation carrier protein SoxY [Leptothrix sp. BB-4]